MNTWRSFDEVLEILAGRPHGLTFILGGPDTGKTTLARRIAQLFLDNGLRVGLVDADVGQSTIGPPTTIGTMVTETSLPDLLRAHALYFVGSNNPVGHLMEVTVGSRRMVDSAFGDGAEAVIFDSSGLIKPPYGQVLKYQKLELLRPQFIVAIERDDELAPLLPWIINCRGTEVVRMRPVKEAHPVPAAARTRYRQEQYRRYFRHATVETFNRDDLCLYPPGFLTGKVDPVGLLVGLQDGDWDTVAIGIIEFLGPGKIGIYAPYPMGDRVRGLVAGSLKLSRAGVELERIKGRQFM